MKKALSYILVIVVLVALALSCGGGDGKDEGTPETSAPPTTPAQTTPAQTTPAPSPTKTIEPTVEPTTSTPEPTVQPSPTPTVNPDAAETVLATVMPRLIVAFAQVDGKWLAYPGPNTQSFSMLENGQLYWWYATETVTLDSITLYKGWNNMMWLSTGAPISSALGGYENKVLFVIRMDIQTGRNYLYQSPAVGELTTIPSGQTYHTFASGTDSPLPQMATQTR